MLSSSRNKVIYNLYFETPIDVLHHQVNSCEKRYDGSGDTLTDIIRLGAGDKDEKARIEESALCSLHSLWQSVSCL